MGSLRTIGLQLRMLLTSEWMQVTRAGIGAGAGQQIEFHVDTKISFETSLDVAPKRAGELIILGILLCHERISLPAAPFYLDATV